MSGYVEYNKKHYGKRIDQLNHIITDMSYEENEFITTMYQALVSGRKITPKMEKSITTIVKRYTKWRTLENDPVYVKKRTEYILKSNMKIDVIRHMLSECDYDDVYRERSEYFLQSVQQFLLESGKLTVKQRKALNSMYKRFEKRMKKVKKSEKKA
tara:strand:- start:8 stop:475 length:468 start_codon:yes stop_codon:yes gene_type:complete